jgi:hypothetical protein
MVRTHTAARVLRYGHRFTQAAAHSTLQPLEFAVARALGSAPFGGRPLEGEPARPPIVWLDLGLIQ